MTYPLSYPPEYQQPQRPAPKPVSSGLAITSLVLGIVGVVLSYMPFFNNLTAAGAFVGVILGFIGIFRSWQWTSAIGIGLCGAAIVLTLMAQKQWSDELDQIEDEFQQDMEQIEQDLSDIPPLPTFEMPEAPK